MARLVNPYSPRTDIGSGMQNIMTALFANKAGAHAAGTGGHRSPAQDVRDQAEAEKARAETEQIRRVESGVNDFVPNFAKSLVPENEVPNVMERNKTGIWPAFEDPRRQQSVTEDVGPIDWSPEKDLALNDAKRNQAYLQATKEANFKDLAGSMEGAASGRDLENTLGQFLPSGKGATAAPAGPAVPNLGLPSGPGMAKAMPIQTTDESGAVTKPYAEVGPIDMNRPKIDNPDGSFSTERTITIEAGGKHFLIPTIVNGQQLTPEQATAAWRSGKNNEVGVYNSPEEAEQAAVARSQQIGNVRGPSTQSPVPPAASQGSAEATLQAPQVDVNDTGRIDTTALLNAAAAVAGKHHEVSSALTGVANAARGQQEADFKEKEKNAWKPLPGVEAAFYNDKGNVIDANGSRELTGDEARALGIKSKQAGATKLNVDVNSFDRTGGAKRAEQAQTMQTNAIKATEFSGLVQALAAGLEGYGGGPMAEFQAKIGHYLPESEYGKIASAEDVVNSIRTKLATTVRATGSGATSDFEMRSYLASIAGLVNTPQGRKMMVDAANRIAEREAIASDIYQEMAQNGPVKLSEWRKAVRSQVGDLFTPEQLRQMREGGSAPVGSSAQPSRQELETEARRRGLR